MKILNIILACVILINCKPIQNEPLTQVEKPPETIQTEQTPKFSLDDLTKEQKKKLDENLPPKVREFLDKAEEIDIFVNLDKETKMQKLLLYAPPNTVAKITDASLKKEILESFYYDTAIGGGASACWSPRHKLTAKFKGKMVDITICYQCNSYQGSSSFGKIFGTVNDEESKSLIILNKAIEKYGVDVR